MEHAGDETRIVATAEGNDDLTAIEGMNEAREDVVEARGETIGRRGVDVGKRHAERECRVVDTIGS